MDRLPPDITSRLPAFEPSLRGAAPPPAPGPGAEPSFQSHLDRAAGSDPPPPRADERPPAPRQEPAAPQHQEKQEPPRDTAQHDQQPAPEPPVVATPAATKDTPATREAPPAKDNDRHGTGPQGNPSRPGRVKAKPREDLAPTGERPAVDSRGKKPVKNPRPSAETPEVTSKETAAQQAAIASENEAYVDAAAAKAAEAAAAQAIEAVTQAFDETTLPAPDAEAEAVKSAAKKPAPTGKTAVRAKIEAQQPHSEAKPDAPTQSVADAAVTSEAERPTDSSEDSARPERARPAKAPPIELPSTATGVPLEVAAAPSRVEAPTDVATAAPVERADIRAETPAAPGTPQGPTADGNAPKQQPLPAAPEIAPPSRTAPFYEARGRQPTGGDNASGVDRARFVQRIARAFHAAWPDGGLVRLRLSPPELGSLRIEVSLRGGVLSARVEAETPAARAALVESLPLLRDRLAEQQVKIDRFDVDLMQHTPDGLPQRQFPDPENSAVAQRNRPRPTETSADTESSTSSARRPAIQNGRLNVIV